MKFPLIKLKCWIQAPFCILKKGRTIRLKCPILQPEDIYNCPTQTNEKPILTPSSRQAMILNSFKKKVIKKEGRIKKRHPLITFPKKKIYFLTHIFLYFVFNLRHDYIDNLINYSIVIFMIMKNIKNS